MVFVLMVISGGLSSEWGIFGLQINKKEGNYNGKSS